jgi:hypothetical protein
LLQARKAEIEAEEAERGYASDPFLDYQFKGNLNGIYIDVKAKGQSHDNDHTKSKLTVKTETMASSEAIGVQIPQASLVLLPRDLLPIDPHL